MSDILCVTNRTLCREAFLLRLEKLAKAHPKGILLREKDLAPEEYGTLASQALALCRSQGVPCILHSHPSIAIALSAGGLHLPLPLLQALSPKERAQFSLLGASCHSLEDALLAQALGCTYVILGHIFATDCKRGLAPRGLALLRQVCEGIAIPVYAIGGITPENISAVREAGAAGGCVMSGAMQCPEPESYLARFAKEGAL